MYNLNSIKNCFESIIEFIEKTDTSGKTKFIGSTPSEIDAFETKYNIQIPPILRLYLQYFGANQNFYEIVVFPILLPWDIFLCVWSWLKNIIF